MTLGTVVCCVTRIRRRRDSIEFGAVRFGTVGLLLVGLVVSGCGVIPEENAGFDRPPVSDIDPIAFEGFPDATVVLERTAVEDYVTTIDSGRFCSNTGAVSNLELAEPTLFSEIRAWHTELAEDQGWTITDGRLENGVIGWAAERQFESRRHRILIWMANPEGGLTSSREDELVEGYRVSYAIGADPEHPFCFEFGQPRPHGDEG